MARLNTVTYDSLAEADKPFNSGEKQLYLRGTAMLIEREEVSAVNFKFLGDIASFR